MRNEEQRLLVVGPPAAKKATRRAGDVLPRQQMRGVAGQLRPYRDVRAGFEPWRRIALLAWTTCEESLPVH